MGPPYPSIGKRTEPGRPEIPGGRRSPTFIDGGKRGRAVTPDTHGPSYCRARGAALRHAAVGPPPRGSTVALQKGHDSSRALLPCSRAVRCRHGQPGVRTSSKSAPVNLPRLLWPQLTAAARSREQPRPRLRRRDPERALPSRARPVYGEDAGRRSRPATVALSRFRKRFYDRTYRAHARAAPSCSRVGRPTASSNAAPATDSSTGA